MTTLRFAEFVKNDPDADPTFAARLLASGEQIGSLHHLKAFAKLRWPDNYIRESWRKPTPDMPYGREAMEALWARYLAAQEMSDA